MWLGCLSFRAVWSPSRVRDSIRNAGFRGTGRQNCGSAVFSLHTAFTKQKPTCNLLSAMVQITQWNLIFTVSLQLQVTAKISPIISKTDRNTWSRIFLQCQNFQLMPLKCTFLKMVKSFIIMKSHVKLRSKVLIYLTNGHFYQISILRIFYMTSNLHKQHTYSHNYNTATDYKQNNRL